MTDVEFGRLAEQRERREEYENEAETCERCGTGDFARARTCDCCGSLFCEDCFGSRCDICEECAKEQGDAGK
jgi:hypothetical protein